MKKTILEYEKFIAEAAKHPSENLWHYHQEMVANFQHERLIHLIVTFFFCGVTLLFIAGACFLTLVFAWWVLIPMYLAALILAGVSVAYVAHYYFLENHIQKLYDYSAKLAKI